MLLSNLSLQLGIGVEKDEEKAVKYYQKAAKDGLADAQLNLGNYFSVSDP